MKDKKVGGWRGETKRGSRERQKGRGKINREDFWVRMMGIDGRYFLAIVELFLSFHISMKSSCLC